MNHGFRFHLHKYYVIDPPLLKTKSVKFEKTCLVLFQEKSEISPSLQPFRRYSRKTKVYDEKAPLPLIGLKNTNDRVNARRQKPTHQVRRKYLWRCTHTERRCRYQWCWGHADICRTFYNVYLLCVGPICKCQTQYRCMIIWYTWINAGTSNVSLP